MAIIDNYLYADMYSALVVFNLSDIDNPELIKDFTVEDVFYYNPYETIPGVFDIHPLRNETSGR